MNYIVATLTAGLLACIAYKLWGITAKWRAQARLNRRLLDMTCRDQAMVWLRRYRRPKPNIHAIRRNTKWRLPEYHARGGNNQECLNSCS